MRTKGGLIGEQPSSKQLAACHLQSGLQGGTTHSHPGHVYGRCRARPSRQNGPAGAALLRRQWDLVGCGACMPTSMSTGSTIRASSSELDQKMKIIGVGQRGILIAKRVQNEFERCQVLSIDAESSKDQEWATREELQQILHSSPGRGPGSARSESEFAFIITSASCIPGSLQALSSLVRSLRDAGVFTAVAIAMPFGFEGSRRLQAANELVSTLRPTASLLALVEQGALMKADVGGVAMTAAEASGIADSALEHTVRCIITAVQAPEILERTVGGALFWHGGDTERSRRFVWQRVQHFLAQPGVAALGRGVAAMSSDLQESMGVCQALMQLASDAVRAAADSPFLEGAHRSATSLLCCISLPEGSSKDGGGEQATKDRAAAKLAVQAAAGTLRELFPCEELLMCYSSQAALELPLAGGKAQLGVGATILVLQPAAVGGLAASDRAGQSSVQTDPVAAPGPRSSSSPRPAPRLPASAWGALSAMAGGSAERHPSGQLHSSPPPPKSSAAPLRAQPQTSKQPPAARPRGTRDILVVSAKAGSTSPPPSAPAPSIGDQLADNLIAQSLDLPPKAAQWRKSQRAKSEVPQLMVQAPEAAWGPQEGQEEGLSATLRSLLGSPQAEINIRERTFAILERDRGDAWDQLEDNP